MKTQRNEQLSRNWLLLLSHVANNKRLFVTTPGHGKAELMKLESKVKKGMPQLLETNLFGIQSQTCWGTWKAGNGSEVKIASLSQLGKESDDDPRKWFCEPEYDSNNWIFDYPNNHCNNKKL